MSIAPETIFDAFLRRFGPGELRATPRGLHRLFYEASLKHPNEMNGFKFLVRSEPYSPTLARLVWEFQQSDRLGRLNPRYTAYEVLGGGDPLPGADDPSVEEVVSTLVNILPGHEEASGD